MKHVILLFSISLVIFSCSSNNNGTVTVVPLAPTNLTGSAISTTQINLSWTDNATNEDGYKIERRTGTGNYAVVGSTASNMTTFNDLGLTPNTSYTYRVYAYNSAGNSLQYSNELTLSTQDSIPSWLTNGLVGYWPFNGNANDESGNGNNGTVNGATLTIDRFGNANKAYSYNGLDNYIVIPNTIYNISISHSLNMWVSINNVSLGGQYLWNTIPHTAEAFVYNWNNINDNKVTYCLGNGTSGNWTITCGSQKVFLTSTPNQWKMFTLTYENNTWRIYINGQLSQEFSNSNLPSGIYSLIFGDIAQPNTYHESLDGKLDDIRIYNRALSASEVAYLASH